MHSNPPMEYRPLLVLLAHAVALRDETKSAIVDIDADAADSQHQLEMNGHRIAEAQRLGSLSKRWYANETGNTHADHLACLGMEKQLLEAHLQSIDARYLQLENELKAKILEISAGDDSLFAVYVPARPADFIQA